MITIYCVSSVSRSCLGFAELLNAIANGLAKGRVSLAAEGTAQLILSEFSSLLAFRFAVRANDGSAYFL